MSIGFNTLLRVEWFYWIRSANKILSLELLAKFTFFLTNKSKISHLLLFTGFYTEGSYF